MKFLKIRNGTPLFYGEIDASHGYTEEEIAEILSLKVRGEWEYLDGKDKLVIKRVK